MSYLAVSFLVLLSLELPGQKLLLHKSKIREEIYQIGDVISFRLKNNKSKITRLIIGFEDSLIIFQDYRINPKEISDVYVDDKTKTWFIFRYKYKNVLPLIGVSYLLIDVANRREVSSGTLVFSGSFIAAGVMAKLFIPDRIKIKGRRKLVILK